MPEPLEIRFACDAMMKGLARCLRACGHDASWTYGIDDRELLEQAVAEDRVVLTADSGILKRRAVTSGRPRALFVPNELEPTRQARRVLDAFDLIIGRPRCLACGGPTLAIDKDSVRDEAPPRTYASVDSFERCQRCARLLWRGTHWQRIEQLRVTIASTDS